MAWRLTKGVCEEYELSNGTFFIYFDEIHADRHMYTLKMKNKIIGLLEKNFLPKYLMILLNKELK